MRSQTGQTGGADHRLGSGCGLRRAIFTATDPENNCFLRHIADMCAQFLAQPGEGVGPVHEMWLRSVARCRPTDAPTSICGRRRPQPSPSPASRLRKCAAGSGGRGHAADRQRFQHRFCRSAAQSPVPARSGRLPTPPRRCERRQSPRPCCGLVDAHFNWLQSAPKMITEAIMMPGVIGVVGSMICSAATLMMTICTNIRMDFEIAWRIARFAASDCISINSSWLGSGSAPIGPCPWPPPPRRCEPRRRPQYRRRWRNPAPG